MSGSATVAALQSAPATRSLLTRLDPGAIAAWALGAAPIIYLGLKNGGFDPDPRGAVGVVVWWILLLAAAAGLLPNLRGVRTAAAPLALLIAFASGPASPRAGARAPNER